MLKDDELLRMFLEVSVKSNAALKAIKIFVMNKCMIHKHMKVLKNVVTLNAAYECTNY